MATYEDNEKMRKDIEMMEERYETFAAMLAVIQISIWKLGIKPTLKQRITIMQIRVELAMLKWCIDMGKYGLKVVESY